MKRLYLDDIRNPIPELKFEVVRNFSQFRDYILKNGVPNLVSFDHDLCTEHILLSHAKYMDWEKYHLEDNREMTGYDCAKWLCAYCDENQVDMPKFIYVHSQNVAGATNIKTYVDNFLKHTKQNRKCEVRFWKTINP